MKRHVYIGLYRFLCKCILYYNVYIIVYIISVLSPSISYQSFLTRPTIKYHLLFAIKHTKYYGIRNQTINFIKLNHCWHQTQSLLLAQDDSKQYGHGLKLATQISPTIYLMKKEPRPKCEFCNIELISINTSS